MASNVIDSLLFRDHFSTEEMRYIFSDENMVQKWLDVEAVLAKVQANLNIIPKEAAEEIKKKADVSLINFNKLKKELELTGHPFMPLIKVLEELCDNGAGEYIHWGATTQDIMDTAVVLQLKEAYALLSTRITHLHSTLCLLADEYKSLTMVGRTNGQHALPITFGFKFAIWAAEVHRSMNRLENCKRRLFTGQFSGAVGTLASLGEQGIMVQRLLMKELDLEVPEITWNSSRDNLVEFASILGIIAGTIGKIGNELYELQKPEFGEVYEEHGTESIGSSTMPHKRNPFTTMEVVSLSKIIAVTVNEAFYTMDNQHERDARIFMIEWDYISRICCMTDTALKKTLKSLANVKPIPANIQKNLELLGDLISSERVMMKLSDSVGRQHSHEIIHEASMEAISKCTTLKKQLIQNEEIMKHFTEETIDSLLDPRNYTGKSSWFVENITKRINKET